MDQICDNFLNNVKNVKDYSVQFSDSRSDMERVALTYNNLLSDVINTENIEKSAVKSKELREVGNSKFLKKLNWEALHLYNKSIAYAPTGSEELAKGYGNRVSCLLSLNLPKYALQEVDRAISVCTDSSYRDKLMKRRELCRDRSNEREMLIPGSVLEIPRLGKPGNSFLQSASKEVQMKEDAVMGRYLIATEYVKTGQTLIVEKPYSSVLMPELYYTHCTNCFKRCVSLTPCPYCVTAMFCSNECYTTSLQNYHKIECSLLPHLVKLGVGRMEFLSLRTLICATHQGSNLHHLYKELAVSTPMTESVYRSDDHQNIYNLVGNTENRSIADLVRRSVIAAVLLKVLESHSSFFNSCSVSERSNLLYFSGGLLLRYLQSIPCNAHEISEFCEDGLEEIGAGIYATLSLINHSCDPNVVRHNYGDTIALKAIRPIQAGEQIFDNYGHHYAVQQFADRQKNLQSQYYFVCCCEACTNNWPTYHSIPDDNPVLKPGVCLAKYQKQTEIFTGNLLTVFSGNYTVDIISDLQLYLDYLDEVVVRPWRPYNKCQEAIKHILCMTSNNFRFTWGV